MGTFSRIAGVMAGVFIGVCMLAGCRQLSMATPVGEAAPAIPALQPVVTGLNEPVDLAFLSPEVLLVAERASGQIRWVERGHLRETPFATLPVPADVAADGGLLSLVVDPDYPRRPYVYALHAVAGGRGANLRITRLTVQQGAGVDATPIVEDLPGGAHGAPAGGRLLFGQDGKLYVALGDAGHPEQAQDYTKLAGKVLRYNADGSVPDDNPLEEPLTRSADTRDVSKAPTDEKPLEGQRTPIYTVGHHDPFGLAQQPETGILYLLDTGPQHDDALSHLLPGDNYGWPNAVGISGDPRFHAPLWSTGAKSLLPAGAAFYTGRAFPQFSGNLFFAARADGKLRRVIFSDRDVIHAITIVPEAGANARLAVAMGPDGNLYFSSDTGVYRLVARKM